MNIIVRKKETPDKTKREILFQKIDAGTYDVSSVKLTKFLRCKCGKQYRATTLERGVMHYCPKCGNSLQHLAESHAKSKLDALQEQKRIYDQFYKDVIETIGLPQTEKTHKIFQFAVKIDRDKKRAVMDVIELSEII